VRLATGETERLRGRVAAAMAAPDAMRPESDDLLQAFALRQDRRESRGRAADAERHARVAANALRAGLDVTIKAAGEQRNARGGGTATDIRFGDGSASATVDLDLPWERTAARNAYRNALLAADKARRDLAVKEDEVKQGVRDARRALAEARESYRIQGSAVDLAERRVRSTAMFLEAGRAQTRDVLESEEALVSAQNAMVGAVVQFCLAQWALARDTGALTTDDEGWWNVEDMQ
jgi:outer membrane protein TolC